MQDLTEGSILSHLVRMSAPVLALMVLQSTYLLVDLYFVASLGNDSIAGVSMAANVGAITTALVQVLSVGTAALISHAVGRRNQRETNLIFNQAISLGILWGLIGLVAGYAFAQRYVDAIGGTVASRTAGSEYLRWFMPALALQFPITTIVSALRGTGSLLAGMMVLALTVILNVILAPVLIAGWGTGRPMGVAGAGLASSLAVAIGGIVLWSYLQYFKRSAAIELRYVRPDLACWKRLLGVGLPAGGEMALMFVYVSLIYWCIKDLGSDAQSGFSVGSRVMQVMMLPVMAISFAAGPIAGQNFGAGERSRVRYTFAATLILNTVITLMFTVFLQLRPTLLVSMISADQQTIATGALFLQLTSLGFAARGMIFACSSIFLGLGDTRPSLISSGIALAFFAMPAIWQSQQAGFRIEQIWYLLVGMLILQAAANLVLLHSQFKKKLSSTTISGYGRVRET